MGNSVTDSGVLHFHVRVLLFIYVERRVCYLAVRTRARRVWNRGRRYLVYVKIDPVKVAQIIGQKRNGAKHEAIAASEGGLGTTGPGGLLVVQEERDGPELGRPGRKRVEPSEAERRAQLACAHFEAPDHNADVIASILERARLGRVEVLLLLLDREFFSASCIVRLNGLGQRFLMPCRLTRGVKEAMRENAWGRGSASPRSP